MGISIIRVEVLLWNLSFGLLQPSHVRLRHLKTTQISILLPRQSFILALLLSANMTPRCKTEPSTKCKDSRANGTINQSLPRTRHPRQKFSQRMQKSEYPRRASLRLQGRLIDTPSLLSSTQNPSYGCEEQVGTRQRKRRRNSEEEPQPCSGKARLSKRSRKGTSAVSDKSQCLNAKNLQRHTVREGYFDTFELVGLESDKTRGKRGTKRSASKVGLENSSTASKPTGD